MAAQVIIQGGEYCTATTKGNDLSGTDTVGILQQSRIWCQTGHENAHTTFALVQPWVANGPSWACGLPANIMHFDNAQPADMH